MRADRAARRRWPRRIDGPTIVCAQAGNVNTGAFDPLDEIVRRRARARRVGPRRRRVRAVGRGLTRASRALVAGVERRGLVGHRRPQVAQRPVRLRHRRSVADADAHRARDDRRAPHTSCRPAEAHRATRSTGCRSSRAARRGFPVYAAHARAGPRRASPSSSSAAARWRARFADAAARPRRTSRSSTTSCSTRCSSGSATRDDRTRAVVDARPARRHLLARWHGVARRRRDAHLGVQLDHDRGRRRCVRRRDPQSRK